MGRLGAIEPCVSIATVAGPSRIFERASITLTLGGALLLPSLARADEPPHDKAAGAFVEARKLIEAGNCDAAVPKLRESLSYESSIGARLSIVDCIEPRDAVSAWRLLKEASALALMNRDERLAVIEDRASVLQGRLATIKFTLPTVADQAGFELRVDGELVDRSLYRGGWAAAAGRHVVEAVFGGRRFTGAVTGELGKALTVNVVLQGDECQKAPVAASASAPAPSIDRGVTRRTLGLSLGGLGLATIANGVVFGLLTLDKKEALATECGGSASACTAPRSSLDPQRESATTTATISTVSFALGGAMLLGGAVLYFTAPSASGPRQGIRMSPRATNGGAGAMVEGTW